MSEIIEASVLIISENPSIRQKLKYQRVIAKNPSEISNLNQPHPMDLLPMVLPSFTIQLWSVFSRIRGTHNALETALVGDQLTEQHLAAVMATFVPSGNAGIYR